MTKLWTPPSSVPFDDDVETFGGWQMWALGLTQGGRPRHPLYMRADVVPFIYEARSAA